MSWPTLVHARAPGDDGGRTRGTGLVIALVIERSSAQVVVQGQAWLSQKSASGLRRSAERRWPTQFSGSGRKGGGAQVVSAKSCEVKDTHRDTTLIGDTGNS
jgi:hypothetical protein